VGELGRGSSMADPSVAAIVVTLDAMPWVERAVESVAGTDTVVVDHGSQDGTVELVRERFPGARVVEQPNLGLAAGWNRGIAETDSDYVLILNADAWLVGDALAELVACAEERRDAAIVAPRLRNPDGSLQRSVRGFPTVWRVATEYLFLRKLAPGSGALNAFYGGGFAHDELREVDWVMGACLLVRRAAVAEVGLLDESFFLFSEETDWCYRFAHAGWKTVFFPGAECVHVGGAAHGGRFYRENVRGLLRFLRKHRGARDAERARRLLRASLLVRSKVFGGERGVQYREVGVWLGSGDVETLLAQ
jgi:N-acetylglucosaminyl-diphospho-decaprenol L-rhamnosyltransferase